MQKAELLALAERVEALEGPNFAIEQEVGRMCNPQATKHSVFPPYTASLDAAMTTAPEGWHIEIKGPRRYLNIPTPVPNYWSANVQTWSHEGQKIGWGATPALALLAAILRAKAGGL